MVLVAWPTQSPLFGVGGASETDVIPVTMSDPQRNIARMGFSKPTQWERQLESGAMIYLDYNATTPLDGRVRNRFLEVLDGVPANAASLQHSPGRMAGKVVEDSRKQAADALGVSPSEIVWTSGATEATTIAILGTVASSRSSSRTLLLSPTEHKAVIAAAELCERTLGARLVWLEVDESGAVLPESVARNISDEVCLVATMHANNETGVINPIGEIAEAMRTSDAALFLDCTQSLGKLAIEEVLPLSTFAVLSSHKAYGPKGVGALVVRSSVKKTLVSIQPGGGQEQGIRGGTHNTAGIAAAALAFELCVSEMGSDAKQGQLQTESLMSELSRGVSDVVLMSGTSPRLPNTLNVRFIGADAEAVMANAPELCVSTGSACNSANPEPSHVLLAMGLQREAAEECVRFSVGRFTTASEISRAVEVTTRAVTRVRQLTAA